jgi:hypothetical protein
MRERTAEINNEVVPNNPANCEKYFLPHNPKKKKLAKGMRSINMGKIGFKVSGVY